MYMNKFFSRPVSADVSDFHDEIFLLSAGFLNLRFSRSSIIFRHFCKARDRNASSCFDSAVISCAENPSSIGVGAFSNEGHSEVDLRHRYSLWMSGIPRTKYKPSGDTKRRPFN